MSIDALAVCPMKGTAFPSAEVEVFVDGFFAAPLPLQPLLGAGVKYVGHPIMSQEILMFVSRMWWV
jgi:hypothetical protein